jgi:aldehyde dehydrogenase (NAD+)
LHERDSLFIGGAWVASTRAGWIEVGNPATEAVIGRVPAGTREDVDAAARAARAALPAWSATATEERVRLLRGVAAGLQARLPEIASLIVEEVGMPLGLAMVMQAGVPPLIFETTATVAAAYPWEEPAGGGLLVREPVGVVGAITPWNFPLQDIACKVAAALAAGCTVVLKPSELAPLNAFHVAEAAAEAGLPPGVLNLVSGTGPVAGEALATHPEVDMISFTGSSRSGRRVAELAGRTVKRLTLELGGKSPCIILDDLDGAGLERAVLDGVAKAFLNSGQNCGALSRMLVPRSLEEAVEALAARAAEELVVGDPTAEGTGLGPVISAAHRDRVVAHVRKGIEEGAKLVTGGPEPPAGLKRGWFVRPTVLSRARPEMTVAQEEIFGPVLTLLAFDGDDEAVAIADGTPYGLNAAVWSADPERAARVARRLHVGQVEINGGELDLTSPFGGCKQSGYGREMGRFGLEEFLRVKTVQQAR